MESAISDCLGLENRSDVFYRACDNFGQLMQAWNNRHILQGKSLIEQYEQSGLSIVCDLAISLPNQPVLSGQVAFENPRTEDRLLASLVFNANVVNDAYINDWKQEPVLIKDVEIVQGPKGVIPSLVRLYGVHDEVSDLWGGSLYESAVYGTLHVIPSFSEWEPSVVVVMSEPRKNDFVNSKVESTLEVVQYVSDDESEIICRQSRHFNFDDIIACLNIRMDAKDVNATSSKGFDAQVKIVDVMLGPLNL